MSANGNHNDLRALWQNSAPVDVQALMRGIARGRARMRLYLLLEIVSTVLLLGWLGWLWREGAFNTGLMSALVALTIALQWWSWSWRRGLWHAVSESPADLLRLQRQRAHMSIKIARSFSWGLPLSLMSAWLARWLADRMGHIGFSLGLPFATWLTIIGLMGVGLCVGTIWGVRREKHCRAEIERLDAQIAALGEDD